MSVNLSTCGPLWEEWKGSPRRHEGTKNGEAQPRIHADMHGSADVVAWLLICVEKWRSILNSEQLAHLLVEKSFSRPIRLGPFAIDDELRDGALAGVAHDFRRRARHLLDVDFGIRDVVPREEALGLAAIVTPRRAVDDQLHVGLDDRRLSWESPKSISAPPAFLRSRPRRPSPWA